MSALVFLFIFVPILALILLGLSLLFAPHLPNSEKVYAIESGINVIHGQNRQQFSIHFYLVGVLFLVFDLEILLIYSLGVALDVVGSFGFWVAMIFFAILTVGFIYEYKSKVLTALGSINSHVRSDSKDVK